MTKTPAAHIVLVLAAACLVIAEEAGERPAHAGSLKLSGSYFAAGIYAENPSLQDRNKGPGRGPFALYHQRLRISSQFNVSEGLFLTTRFDAMEGIWGAADTTGSQNIAFEQAYVTFRTAAGIFLVGTQDFDSFGTAIMDSGTVASASGIKYLLPLGSLTLAAAFRKDTKGAGITTGVGQASDADADIYYLMGTWRDQAREAGLLYEYLRNAVFRPIASPIPAAPNGPYLSTLHVFLPYAKMKAGNLSLEAEGVYAAGDWCTYERPAVPPSIPDVKAETYAFYLGAKLTLGPGYVGGIFIYARGDDYGAADRQEGGFAEFLNAGGDFNPCLIFMNYWYTTVVGSLTPASGGNAKSYFNDNLRFYQVYAGIRPLDRLELRASYALALADKKPRTAKGLPLSATNREFESDRYGTEIDFTTSYMLYDNLEYMVGLGYFFTGDYFKGDDPHAAVADNYLLMHKLTLNF